MDRDETVAVLFTENGKGEIRKSEITQEELGKIFFGEVICFSFSSFQ